MMNKGHFTDPITFADDRIFVTFDGKSGYTKTICYPNDAYRMNWILEDSDWGHVSGFPVQSVDIVDNGIDVCAVQNDVTLTVRKRITNGRYSELYVFQNTGNTAVPFSKETLGIHFPYNCTFENKTNLHDMSCVTHVWCGGDYAWMYSAKPSGESKYLVCYVNEGCISDYSISYDVSRVSCGASYRGAIVLHPGEFVLEPGAQMRFSFVFYFSDQAADTGMPNDDCRMTVSANRYNAFVGKSFVCSFKSLDPWDDMEITCNGKPIAYQKTGQNAVWMLSADTPGEQIISVSVNGKKLCMKLNVLLPAEELLVRRAQFITRKQQYHKIGNPLDGAYLIYDRDTDTQFYESHFADHNACRERLAMGVVVAQALQKRYDAAMMQSLEKHRAFIEREIFDRENFVVRDSENRNHMRIRAYNYPWMAVYYLEWYLLTGERECLENAAGIMISYYENANGGRQESPCIRNHEICRYLKAEGMESLYQKLLGHTLAHADRIIRDGSHCFSEEVRCTQFMFNGKVNILCQAFLLTDDNRYLQYIAEFMKKSDAFSAKQPDYHVHLLAVRYWDLYWFGKTKTYGDTMPQWLSALTAETYMFLSETGFGDAYREAAESILQSNLCVFFPDGFASAGYLVPYKVVQFTSDPSYKNDCLIPGTAYGHSYDSYANDQDWALYYTVKLLMNKN